MSARSPIIRYVPSSSTLIFPLVADCYGHNGRESVPPEIILKLMVLLFHDNIARERELMRMLPERLDYLCRRRAAAGAEPLWNSPASAPWTSVCGRRAGGGHENGTWTAASTTRMPPAIRRSSPVPN